MRSITKETSSGRFLIRFREYAAIDVPHAWKKGDRNPVTYRSLEELQINPAQLNWKPMPSGGPVPQLAHEVATGGAIVRALTIPEAKEGLALTFKVPPEAIEIIVRG